jgi:leader peptidase (prepilin peptidase)/N-methyltransferase
VLSLLVGSFLNVVIHRLPVMLDRQWRAQAEETLAASTGGTAAQSAAAKYNLVVPRSACPHCGAEIRAHQNIPVLSYLLLGGKCANCKAAISARYPLVELGTAILSAAVVWKFGWQWQAVAALVFTWALVALTVIDLDHQILPDAITQPLLWMGLLCCLVWQPGPALSIPVDPWSAIIGAAAGYLSLWLVYWSFKLITGKEGMGYGDFSAFTGAAIGMALIVLRGRDRNIPIPFGPYLAAAGWIALMWGPQLVGRYLFLTGLDR